jgi:hypothetical protein
MLPPLEDEVDSKHWLGVYFCGCALQGLLLAGDNDGGGTLNHDDEWYAAKAYDIGAATFELYVQEDLSAVRRFNRKVGL